LRTAGCIRYNSPPVLQRSRIGRCEDKSETTARQDGRGVDELRETLHNLTSLLLTNKTIRRTQQGSTEYEVL
jgi:hypothetical protein